MNGHGIHPQTVGALPPQLARAQPDLPQRGGADRQGGPRGDRQHVYHAALLDPNTAATLTTSQTVEMCDELFAAHGDLMSEGLRR